MNKRLEIQQEVKGLWYIWGKKGQAPAVIMVLPCSWKNHIYNMSLQKTEYYASNLA